MARVGRTFPLSTRLRPPAIINPAPLAPAIRIRLAGRSRVELSRHASHYKLSPPLVILPLAGERERTLRIILAPRTRGDASRRASHYKLFPPAVVTAASTFIAPAILYRAVPVKTRTERGRHATHYRLLPPVVVSTPVAPTFDQMRIAVHMASQTRNNIGRRRSHGQLFGVIPPTPVVSSGLHSRTLTGVGL